MFHLEEARAWLPGARRVGEGTVDVSRVHTDTRSLAPGDLFVALRGERFDAHDFLDQARARGAAAALCEYAAADRLAASGLPGLLVPDTRQALAALAAAWRARFRIPLIAVTGSNGKTTVTQMVASILRAWKPQASLATQGNLNNDIGVPLTLLRLRPHHEVAVLELGMNHPGEIAALAALARPTVALVNNAQREHLEFMATVEAVARENGAVLAALPPDGVALFPADDAYSPLWHDLADQRPCLTLDASGAAPDRSAALRCDRAQWDGQVWQLQLETPAGPLQCRLPIAGRHNVANALAAAGCALAAGAPLAAVAQGLSDFEPVKGRSRTRWLALQGRTVTLVDDSYNANPDSVRAAIEVLASLPAPRLLVLGDMAEVGEQGPAFHAEAGALARQHGIEQVFTLGDLSSHTAQAFGAGRHWPDIGALQQAVCAQLPQLGSLLVKGSRFMRMERVVEAVEAAVHAS
ncbi:MAG: UDP-N-acetylmuramoyl-tripeptide--D-alanyl-D-alanine ligase [Rhodoferax sp.]|nr:UDP-N-acetylmuramoyl-tripeptide--D-alanyl-D-alanine ligase [Rhodoferax sp.]